MSTATALRSASARRGGGPQTVQPDERQDRHDHHRGNEIRRNPIRQALDGCAAALSLADHPHDLRQQRIASDPLGPDKQCPGRIDRATCRACPGLLLGRHGLAGHHRFVDCAAPLDDHAVHGDGFAGPDAAEVANLDLVERNVEVHTLADKACGFRRESEELPDRRAGSAACPQLQDLSEQHEDRDHHGRIEVGLHDAVHPEPVRKAIRRQRCAGAVNVGGTDAQRDEREHVRASIQKRCPRALEEGPAGPEHNRRRERQARPG